MKHLIINKKVIAAGLVLGLGAFVIQSTQAAVWMNTTRGPRITTDNSRYIPGEYREMDRNSHNRGDRYTSHNYREHHGYHLATLNDFRNLREGDRVSIWCPMTRKTQITTVRNVDTKGHAKFTETRNGLKMDGCNLVLRRKSGSREVNSMMVCPDGSLTSVECHKM